MNYDVIIIGGGPSGLMAAVASASNGSKVLLVDKGTKLGKKLAISGGGRCNVTNRLPIDEIIKHIPGNGRFLYSAFTIFNNESIIKFFEGLGIQLKEEDHGRMFPTTDKAQSVVDAMLKKIRELGVEIRTNTAVKQVIYDNQNVKGIKVGGEEIIKSKAVIIAVGGKSVPHTGSTGDGYAWAKAAGHTITELYPTEVPITSKEPFIKEKTLQGLSLRDVGLSVLKPNGKPIITHRMDMIFTHFGISGPAVLRCSQFVVKALKKSKENTVTMEIDLMPDQNQEEIFQEAVQILKSEPKKAIKNALKGWIPERYLHFLLEQAGIDLNTVYDQLSHRLLRYFAGLIKGFRLKVNGTLSIEKAFVTGGGVSTKEIEPKTMRSKIINGLYFCGEILDIHGYTGGYNITSAFVTGHLAGTNAANEQ
ncbi:NAD(P)/FAD-dependent oxidoreductase [Pseudalkalibacillus decolorationis]|uniref:NAD(P)/FAD-dependent oxidoreductase n=1 Tax=Pseudalkalibacillus decolorationis TaxID=163879 RepID=UPI002148CD2A|nr:NAD(P)/FAD-dependent oxidoreductase [Pseudalkalibacillus decolorationis]